MAEMISAPSRGIGKFVMQRMWKRTFLEAEIGMEMERPRKAKAHQVECDRGRGEGGSRGSQREGN
jgi:hypothetical protein